MHSHFAPVVNCGSFKSFCSDQSYSCYTSTQLLRYGDQITPLSASFTFSSLENYESDCLKCEIFDHTLYTLIFNTFIFCQVFNMFCSRHLLDKLNTFSNLHGSHMFIAIIAVIVGLQVVLIQAAGEGFQTTPLTATQWFITIALGGPHSTCKRTHAFYTYQGGPEHICKHWERVSRQRRQKPLRENTYQQQAAVKIRQCNTIMTNDRARVTIFWFQYKSIYGVRNVQQTSICSIKYARYTLLILFFVFFLE